MVSGTYQIIYAGYWGLSWCVTPTILSYRH